MASIKRYTNRKLYDTDSRRYVTLDDIANMIRRGEDVRVVDHVTGEDLTSLTMLQVVFEEQKKIGGLMPQVFLSRLIRAGGERMSAVRSRILSMDPLQVVDEEIRSRVKALVEQGRVTAEEGARMADLLARKPTRADVIRIPVRSEDGEQPAQGSSAADEPVDPAEVEMLMGQIQALEQELERLKQSGTQAAPPEP